MVNRGLGSPWNPVPKANFGMSRFPTAITQGSGFQTANGGAGGFVEANGNFGPLSRNGHDTGYAPANRVNSEFAPANRANSGFASGNRVNSEFAPVNIGLDPPIYSGNRNSPSSSGNGNVANARLALGNSGYPVPNSDKFPVRNSRGILRFPGMGG